MKRTKRMRLMLIVVLVLTVSTIFIFNIKKAIGSINTAADQIITVESGDTLWDIAKNNCTNYKDIRKVIYDIKKLNNLQNSNITPGTHIRIPSCYSAL